MINQHPQPVDDCPCFEDSIAFVSSMVGILLGEWHAIQFGLLQSTNPSYGDISNWAIWLSFAVLKLFFGKPLIV
jgi:dihydrosphingosine 1-phosphate phosphatase